MKRLLFVCLLVGGLTGCSASPSSFSGSNGAVANTGVVSQAVSTAQGALNAYSDLQAQLYGAQNQQQAAAIEGQMEQSTRGALQTILNLVVNTTTASPPAQVTIYQTAKDALGAGNSSGDVMTRVNYNLGALSKIAGLGTSGS